MAKMLHINSDNPQERLIAEVCDCLHRGGLIALPSETSYSLACHLGDKKALMRLRQLRQLDEKHEFTVMCRDLSELATYAKVENYAFRLLKSCTPGAYTFILSATKEVPKRLIHPKKKTIGLRVPTHAIAQAVLQQLQQPILTTTLQLPGESLPLYDPYEIEDSLGHGLDCLINGGYGDYERTSVIDLTGSQPIVLRAGKGDVSIFE